MDVLKSVFRYTGPLTVDLDMCEYFAGVQAAAGEEPTGFYLPFNPVQYKLNHFLYTYIYIYIYNSFDVPTSQSLLKFNLK